MAQIADINFPHHEPVLLTAAVDGLLADCQTRFGRQGIENCGLWIDATFGAGGHSRALLAKMPVGDRLLALDCDLYAKRCAQQIKDSRFCFCHRNFAQLEALIGEQQAPVQVRGILMDLGVSSMQLDTPERGFSFQRAGDLDMRLDTRQSLSAKQWLDDSTEEHIADTLKRYGQEPESRKIARALVKNRHLISKTTDLARVVCETKRQRVVGKNPATQVFQAIRIAINRELDNLQIALAAATNSLAVGGRLVVIAFHSLEDRLVKQWAAGRAFPGLGRYYGNALRPLGCLQKPSAQDITKNPRCRSAVLRVFVKIETKTAINN